MHVRCAACMSDVLHACQVKEYYVDFAYPVPPSKFYDSVHLCKMFPAA